MSLPVLPSDDDKLREECGVFGIIGVQEAASFVALGLHALQHRGQEAAGIVMSTVQTMLIERIASNYVKAKVAERGDIEMSSAQQLELGKHVLALQSEFNKLLVQNADGQRAAQFDAALFGANGLIASYTNRVAAVRLALAAAP